MAVQAFQIIDSVAKDLHDTDGVRWTREDLLAYLNDGQREVLLYRPDASTTVVTLNLVPGWLQSIPATAIRLLRVLANDSGRACTLTDSASLDAIKPDWRNDAPSIVIKAWAKDDADPKRFQVWPPAPLMGAQLKAVLTMPPTDCATESSAISLDDQYMGPLRSYVLFRAFGRDSEDAAMAQLSAGYYALMVKQLSGRTDAEMGMAPKAKEGGK